MMGGVKFTHVPYRGAAPALTDLVGGTANIMFDNLGVSLTQVQGGKIRLLGVATRQADAVAAGRPDHRRNAAGVRVGRVVCGGRAAGTPKQIVEKINADINEALRDPGVAKRMAGMSAEIVGGSTQETAAYFRSEVDRWHKVIKAANVKVE